MDDFIINACAKEIYRLFANGESIKEAIYAITDEDIFDEVMIEVEKIAANNYLTDEELDKLADESVAYYISKILPNDGGEENESSAD